MNLSRIYLAFNQFQHITARSWVLKFMSLLIGRKNDVKIVQIFVYMCTNMFMTSKIEFSNPPILEFKVLPDAFRILKQGLKYIFKE